MRMMNLLILSILLTSVSVIPQANAQETDSSAPSRAKKQIAGVIETLNTSVDASQFRKAFDEMTTEAEATFVAQSLMTCLDIKSYAEPKLSAKFAAICKQVGISEKLLPEAFVTGEGISSEEEFEALQAKAEKSLLKAVGDKTAQLRALKIIFKAARAIPADSGFFPFNPFDGSFTELTETDEGLTARLDGDLEPSFHTFIETDDGWKWNGIDEEMYFDWLEQPLPLIEDIRIAGRNAEGDKVDLKNYRGKVVLVDFWGTWCGPCVAELPTLKKIYEALHSKGFDIIGVAQDDAQTLKTFLKKRKLPWSNIVDGQSVLSQKYKINAFPTTLLINAQGEHYVSDLSGTELLDELINQLRLPAEDYTELRKQIEESGAAPYHDSHDENESTDGTSPGMLPVGFEAADSNSDDAVSQSELKTYLDARLPDELPIEEIHSTLDEDNDGSLSRDEFDRRHEVIEGVMGLGYLSGMEPPEDPGDDFVPIRDLSSPVDDRKIFGAVFHRYYDSVDAQVNWQQADLSSVPESCSLALPEQKSASSLAAIYKSTLILAGGGDQMFAAGAVTISEDGLALTNYHVAEALESSKLFALRHDGKTFPVTEILAGNRDRDVALIRIAGSGFTPVAIAKTTPVPGDNLEMIHHSENRFFTYDRGYLMRHPIIGEYPWMEVSMDYAPGGSGCGIFNEQRELVGLVSTIQFGDGPSIAEPFTDWDPDQQSAGEPDLKANEEGYGGESFAGSYGEGGFQDEALIMVKQAVSLDSIHSLFSTSLSK